MDVLLGQVIWGKHGIITGINSVNQMTCSRSHSGSFSISPRPVHGTEQNDRHVRAAGCALTQSQGSPATELVSPRFSYLLGQILLFLSILTKSLLFLVFLKSLVYMYVEHC